MLSPEAGAAGPSLAPLTLPLCRTVTHQLSLGRSLPQSGQICPPAPLPPAVWKKHPGTASQNQENRVQPTPNHYGELVPLPGHLQHLSLARTILSTLPAPHRVQARILNWVCHSYPTICPD